MKTSGRLTKRELLALLANIPMEQEIQIGIGGNPQRLYPVEAVCNGEKMTVLVFADVEFPLEEPTFLCRTCRGVMSVDGQKCPACHGNGRQPLSEYRRW